MSERSSFLRNFVGQRLEPAEGGLAASIRNNLALLLNSRQGMLAHQPDFGLPDIHYIYYSLPRSLESLAEDIAETIQRFEPRIHKVKVKLIDSSNDTFCAKYQIIAEVVEGSEISRLTFKTEVLHDGSAQTQLSE